MKKLAILFSILTTVSACNRTRETLHKGGEVVGQGATEFIDGMGTGIDKSLALKIDISESLQNDGLGSGKYYVKDLAGGRKNQLFINLIFGKDFDRIVILKVFDKDGLEIGRVVKQIKGKTGETEYAEFDFPVPAELENRGRISIDQVHDH